MPSWNKEGLVLKKRKGVQGGEGEETEGKTRGEKGRGREERERKGRANGEKGMDGSGGTCVYLKFFLRIGSVATLSQIYCDQVPHSRKILSVSLGVYSVYNSAHCTAANWTCIVWHVIMQPRLRVSCSA